MYASAGTPALLLPLPLLLPMALVVVGIDASLA
jgi:hypothetical protein